MTRPASDTKEGRGETKLKEKRNKIKENFITKCGKEILVDLRIAW